MILVLQRLFYFIVIPASVMYLFEAYTHNPFVRMYPAIQILNILLFVLLTVTLFFACGSLRLALQILTVTFLLFGLAEYYLVEFRGVPFLPWDLGSLGTAAEVAGGYDYMPSKRAFLCMAGFLIVFIISSFADLKVNDITRSIPARAVVTFTGIILIFGYTKFVQTEFAEDRFRFYTKLFTPAAMSERDGTLTAFLIELQYINVKRPEGYDREKAKALLAEYEGLEDTEDKANVIVIMNEAFSDLKALGEFETNTDYMPYVHSLEKGAANVETGTLNVSIIGGNTPNTEFEFLTGNSLAFLPEGCIPYQQYVREGIEAMPGYMSSVGYNTIAMHPYYAKGWDRKRVYPELGFERSVFLDDMEGGYDKVRDYMSDQADMEWIIKAYEDNKKTGKPLFLFNVTMQNHSPYDKDHPNLKVDVELEGALSDKAINSTERYLTLIKKSDEAFKYLTEYFEGCDDKTVIVMFGDHQPTDSVVRPVWAAAGKDPKNLDDEDVDKRYMVPYVIWTNFETDKPAGDVTSANFLGNRVMEIAGAGYSPYRGFLERVSETYPVFSAVRTEDKNGKVVGDRVIKKDDLVTKYKMLQYYELFDRQD